MGSRVANVNNENNNNSNLEPAAAAAAALLTATINHSQTEPCRQPVESVERLCMHYKMIYKDFSWAIRVQ